ncbi:MAG: galactosyldiacylglycerol synthase [Christensenellaceae bacterium]|jgi:processive 1,2-diacylglycerol beta-glucosyltransferase|nr:galactosyldiacylglycerol synthase [Christensenellaceae bacterium]
MRILILSVTAGQGHNRTAQGIADYASARGHTCRIVNTFEYISPAMGEIVDEGYKLSVQLTPKAFGRAFGLFERAERKEAIRMYMAYRAVSRRLSREIEQIYLEFEPDVVVATMSFAAQIATSIFEHGVSAAKRVGIVTDYTLHPFWIGTDLDALVTPSEQLTEGIVAKGIPREIIHPLGIPIAPVFGELVDRAEALQALSLDNLPTLLIMGGSMGHGDMAKAIARLDRVPSDFQMLAVCGSNEKMLHALEKLRTKKPLKIYGFSNEVHLLMSASDAIITKPGGLTISESIAKRLPMVLVNPIPGQEDRNLDFLTNHGMAMRATKTQPLEEIVAQLMLSPTRRELMRQAQQAFGHPNATHDVCKLLESLVEDES